MHNLTIQFPTKESLRIFAEWMSDGGGEQTYFEAMDAHSRSKPALRIGYHGPENEQYPRNDKRRYGTYLADNTLRVEIIEE